MSAHRVLVFSAKAAWCRACTCMHTSVPCCNCTPLHQVSYVVTMVPAGSMQVLSSAGTWQPVALGPNQVAVFAGETLEHATAGAVHAALHRVSQREVRRSPSFRSAYAHIACCASSVRLFHAGASCEQATIAFAGSRCATGVIGLQAAARTVRNNRHAQCAQLRPEQQVTACVLHVLDVMKICWRAMSCLYVSTQGSVQICKLFLCSSAV